MTNKMADMKEKFGITVKAGTINVDDLESINNTIEQQVLQAAAGLKARGFTSAQLVLQFKATAES
jgi:hypothetical protein